MPAQTRSSQPGTLLDAALRCAARGWHVFPVRPRAKKPPAFPDHDAARCTGTDPRCRSGHQGWEPRATTDPARIGRAWAATPYTIGIAPRPVRTASHRPGQAQARGGAAAGVGRTGHHRWRGRAHRAVRAARPAAPFETFMVRSGPRQGSAGWSTPAGTAATWSLTHTNPCS